MQNIKVLVYMALFSCSFGISSAQAQDHFEGLSKAENALVEAMRNHDELALRDLLVTPGDFFEGPHLDSEFLDFLWNGESFRAQHPDWKGLQSISELSEYDYLKVMRAEQPDGSIIVSFVPSPFIDEATTINFFTEEWLIKFYACQFKSTDRGWKIVNLCFAASSGPYPEPYG